jgi:hypothetical protein
MLCSYMTSALIVGTKNMNIVQMVLDVTTIYALVQDLEQHSCNMVPTPKIEIGQFFSIY